MTHPTELPAVPDRTAISRDRFAEATAGHQMQVLHDDGLYRHLRFRNPDRGEYWYDLITAPGTLTITGDMGDFLFRRVEDMFDFFGRNSTTINGHYWAQKVVAGITEEFDADLYKQNLTQEFFDVIDSLSHADRDDLWSDIEWLLLSAGSTESAYQAMSDWSDSRMPLEDSFETPVTSLSTTFLWCCWAIVAGISRYSDAKKA
jgi:hypothetical protein